jgi:hypothetical protein
MTLRMPADRLWLCVPMVVLAALDVGITLAGQSAEYWAGDRSAVLEANPIARAILSYQPSALVAFAVVGTAGCCLIVCIVPFEIALGLAFIPSFTHAIGASTWMVRHGGWGWLAAVAFLIAAERLVHLSWQRARLHVRPSRAPG